MGAEAAARWAPSSSWSRASSRSPARWSATPCRSRQSGRHGLVSSSSSCARAASRAHRGHSAPPDARVHERHARPHDIRVVGRAAGQRRPALRLVEIARRRGRCRRPPGRGGEWPPARSSLKRSSQPQITACCPRAACWMRAVPQQAARTLDIVAIDGMADRPVHFAVLGAPCACAPVQLGLPAGLESAQLGLQHLGEQLVVAIGAVAPGRAAPAARSSGPVAAACPPSRGVRGRASHSGADRRSRTDVLVRNSSLRGRQPREELFPHVFGHEAIVAARTARRPDDLLLLAQRQSREVEARGPALGPSCEREHLLRRELDPGQVAGASRPPTWSWRGPRCGAPPRCRAPAAGRPAARRRCGTPAPAADRRRTPARSSSRPAGTHASGARGGRRARAPRAAPCG